MNAHATTDSDELPVPLACLEPTLEGRAPAQEADTSAGPWPYLARGPRAGPSEPVPADPATPGPVRSVSDAPEEHR